RLPPRPTFFPYTTLFRSAGNGIVESAVTLPGPVDYGTVLNYQFTAVVDECNNGGSFKNTAWTRLLTHGENAIGATTDLIYCGEADRKSTRLNSSHVKISY